MKEYCDISNDIIVYSCTVRPLSDHDVTRAWHLWSTGWSIQILACDACQVEEKFGINDMIIRQQYNSMENTVQCKTPKENSINWNDNQWKGKSRLWNNINVSVNNIYWPHQN